MTFQLVFEELFDTNEAAWSEGEFAGDDGTSFYGFVDGRYETGFSVAGVDQTYYSSVPFVPGPGLFYVETGATSRLAGSQCGLALLNPAGSLLVAAIGDGRLNVRLFVDGALASEGSYDVAIDDAQQNDIGLWIEGTSVSLYLLDEEIDTFVEPADRRGEPNRGQHAGRTRITVRF